MAHLTKPQTYNIEDTNIALLGSDVRLVVISIPRPDTPLRLVLIQEPLRVLHDEAALVQRRALADPHEDCRALLREGVVQEEGIVGVQGGLRDWFHLLEDDVPGGVGEAVQGGRDAAVLLGRLLAKGCALTELGKEDACTGTAFIWLTE